MLSFKYSVCILHITHTHTHTGFFSSPLPSHSFSSSFSHSVMLFSMLSFYVAHSLPLRFPHSLSVTRSFSLFHTHTHKYTHLYEPPSVVNKQNRTGSVAEAQGPLLSARWLWKRFPARTNWYLQSGEIWLCLD